MRSSKSFSRWIFLSFAIATITVCNTQAQFFSVRAISKFGGDGSQVALGMGRADGLTNAYVLGAFSTTLSIGNFALTNLADFPKPFVARFSNSLQGTNDPVPVFASAPAIDAPVSDLRIGAHLNGGLQMGGIIAGSFAGTNVGFDNLAVTNVSPGLSSDVFIGKYSNTGNASWLSRLGGNEADRCGDLTVDFIGNSYLAGSFQSGVFVAGNTNLIRQNTSGSDSFLVKISPTGTLLWARQGAYAAANKVALDAQNNCYVGGESLGASTFDGVTPTNSTTGQFLVKYTSGGSPVWARGDIRIGNQLAIDRNQCVISAGTFSGIAQFGGVTLSNNAVATIFLAKYDTNGVALWAKQLPGLGNDEVTALYLDSRSNCWLTGSVAYDDGGNRVAQRMFLACFSSTGNLLEYQQASDGGISAGNGISFLQGGIILCGTFSTNLTFAGHSLTNNGDSDFFLIKFSPVPPAIQTTLLPGSIVHSWPSPQSLGFDATDTFVLETSSTLSGWTPSSNAPTLTGGQYVVTNSIANDVQFYRLRK